MAEARRTNANRSAVTPGKTYDFVYGRLLQPMGPDKARAYATFCQAIYDYVQQNHDLSDGLKQIADANKLEPMARALELTKSVGTLGDVRLSGVAGVTNVFVDRFKALADYYGVELNDCSLAVTKVCLDIGSAGVGAVSSVTGLGVVWLGLSVIATFQDSYDLGKVCVPQ
jgi:hypothetical protein